MIHDHDLEQCKWGKKCISGVRGGPAGVIADASAVNPKRAWITERLANPAGRAPRGSGAERGGGSPGGGGQGRGDA
jgi:hypothetical protein